MQGLATSSVKVIEGKCTQKHRLYRLRNRDSTRRYFTRAINVVQNGVYSGGYIMAIHILLDSTTT